jgi:hypothetical protein
MSALTDMDKVLAWMLVQPAGTTWTAHEVASLLMRDDFTPTVTLADGSEATIGDLVDSIDDEVDMCKEIRGFDGDIVFAIDPVTNIHAVLDRKSIIAYKAPMPDTWEWLKNDILRYVKTGSAMEYWGCSEDACKQCPAKADGKTPKERYGTTDCGHAILTDAIARAKALGGVA